MLEEILKDELSMVTVDKSKFPKYLAAPRPGVGCRGSSCSGTCG